MKKQTAYTLIELMIALVLGLIVVGATVSIYIATVGSSSGIIKSARLNHDLDAVMTLMINDIKRAGYWGGATVAADSRNNPFTAATTNLTISGNCILYTYDGGSGSTGGVPHNGNGIVDSDEYYGFKLINNSIQMRLTCNPSSGDDCTDCTEGDWEEFIDSDQLNISTLQFSFVPITGLSATSRCLNVTANNTVTNAAICTGGTAGDNVAEKRLVNILLAGELKSEGTVTKNLSGTVEVRNNRLCVWNGTDCP